MLGLPRYASAPNTLLTAHAMTVLGLHPMLAAWLIQAPKDLTAAQVTQADHWAAANGLTVETTSQSAQAGLQSVSFWAIAVGVLAVLAVLAMTVGLIRSETASDLRVLAATGASGRTRRMLTGRDGRSAGTARSFARHGRGLSRHHRLESRLPQLSAVPVGKLAILIAGLPLLALAAGWLLAGREPPAIARQPLD